MKFGFHNPRSRFFRRFGHAVSSRSKVQIRLQGATGVAQRRSRNRCAAFTLLELLVVIGVISILAGLLLPALAKANAKGKMVACGNQIRQLQLAWFLYAGDNEDRLVYNLGAAETKRIVAERAPYQNWVNNVLSWELDGDNTNLALLTDAALGRYLSGGASVFRCPEDRVVSPIQRSVDWTSRTRSISMNAMVGDAGEFSRGPTNVNNPAYRQFLKSTDFKHPSDIFVFIEEHPDSVNDGYFLNKPRSGEWIDLPASYHNGAAHLTFGDGHLESHRWRVPSTKPPPLPDAADLPFAIPEEEEEDFYWLIKRTTVYERHAP